MSGLKLVKTRVRSKISKTLLMLFQRVIDSQISLLLLELLLLVGRLFYLG
jgi:hypothetical protein